MKKRVVTILASALSMFLSACGIAFNEDTHIENRVTAIVDALENEDTQALSSLFSKNALDAIDEWDNQFDSLLGFFEGNIISWEKDDGKSGDTSIKDGKKTVMLRYGFNITTDVDEYRFFLFDYAIDNIDPDNEGLYMLEVYRTSYDGEGEAWQDRMKAGISIIE